MKILNKGRGRGKSLQLLYTSETTGYQIICPNEQQAQYLKKMAEELGLIIPEPMSYKKYASIKGSSLNTDKILIDNVDHILDEILTTYFKTNICAATMSVPMKE